MEEGVHVILAGLQGAENTAGVEETGKVAEETSARGYRTCSS